MSRNFEALRKANRIEELFGPEPARIRGNKYGEALALPDGHSGAEESNGVPSPSPVRSPEGQANIETPPRGIANSQDDWWHLVQFLFPSQNVQAGSSIGICATRRDESAGTVVAKLGEYASRCIHSPILLVEANFRRPSLAQILGVPAAPGLREMLAARPQAEGDCIHKSRFDDLYVVPAGDKSDWRRVGDSGDAFSRVYETLRARFRNLVVELSPGSDGDLLFPYSVLNAVVLVVSPNSSGAQDVQGAIRKLRGAKANLVGIILNDVELGSAGFGTVSSPGRSG